MFRKELQEKIAEVLSIPSESISLEHPEDFSHGDYSTNIAMVEAKKEGEDPKNLAESLVAKLSASKLPHALKIEVAGPGFINFYLTREFFSKSIENILYKKENFGKSDLYENKKVIVEHTDPNLFKPFHIGHLMSNAIGESIARLFKASGADVINMNYYSDSGLNIAMAVWGIGDWKNKIPNQKASLADKADFLGNAYVHGVAEYEKNESVKSQVREINKTIHNRVVGEYFDLYQKGKEWSIKYLEEIYKILGSEFSVKIAESEISEEGKKLVEQYLNRGVFEKGDEGAIIFPGEKHGLHTRVFISKEGLPTYEAKEFGLTKKKFKEYNADISVVVTANETNDYFKVIVAAIREVQESWAERMVHLGHGKLRLTTGKMSSRVGNIINAYELIADTKVLVNQKMEGREIDNKENVAEEIAIGAIKYSVLKQSPGRDIIFDFDKSISFEGDSGPYLQYTAVRANSVLEKAKIEGIKNYKLGIRKIPEEITEIEKLLYRFPEIIERATLEYAPQHLTNYLIKVAGAFNTFYANTKILDNGEYSSYRLALTEAVKIVLTNGLNILAIKVPEKM